MDLDDVGEAAAVVLTEDGHGGATYELVGPPAFSQIEVASVLSAVLGRSVRAEEGPLAAWQARARAGGMGEYERATLAAMFRYYAEHGLIGVHWSLAASALAMLATAAALLTLP